MTTLHTQLQSICANGGHIRVSLTVDGVAQRVVHLETSAIREPVTNADIEVFTKLWLKLYSKGKTLAQIRNGLTAGFEVTT